MLKKLFVIILILSLGLFIIACGEEVEDRTTDDLIEITVAAGAVGEELELTQKAVQRYNEQNIDVNVRVIDAADVADDRQGLYTQTLAAESSEIDVMQIDNNLFGELGEHFLDLYDYRADEVVEQHFDLLIEASTLNGKLVAIPWFVDMELLYYRKDLLSEYEFSPPETWEELEETAINIWEEEKTDNPNFKGFVSQDRAGENLVNDNFDWSSSYNNTLDVKEVFQAGDAAFMSNWTYILKEEDSLRENEFGVRALPEFSNREADKLALSQLAVNKYSQNPEIAVDVALFMASYQEQKIRAIEAALNPTIEGLYDDEEVLEAVPFFAELYDVFVSAQSRP